MAFVLNLIRVSFNAHQWIYEKNHKSINECMKTRIIPKKVDSVFFTFITAFMDPIRLYIEPLPKVGSKNLRKDSFSKAKKEKKREKKRKKRQKKTKNAIKHEIWSKFDVFSWFIAKKRES